MSREHTKFVFPIVLVLTAVVAMLPARARLPWSRDVGGIVRGPLRPFTHAGNTISGWLRPAHSTADGLPADEELIERLLHDRDVAERLYLAEHQRVRELEEETRQLQMIDAATLARASSLLTAHVTARSPGSPHGPVELRMEPGGKRTVPSGSVGVYAGVHLIGRTVGDSKRGVCTLLPIASRATGPLQARVFPADKEGATIEDAAAVLLEPAGGGSFTGEVARDRDVARGDVVRLTDPGWPTAQMMVLGRVATVTVSDREPLRNVITVEPEFQVRELASLTLLVERSAATGGAGGPDP